MSETALPIVQVQALRFAFPKAQEALFDNFSLEIRAGEFVCIMGPSGCGKSTLLRLIGGLLKVQEGSITVAGWEGDPARAHRLAIGFAFQDARLLPWRSVLSNVMFGMEGLELTRQEMTQRASEALALVGLGDFQQRWPHQLSGGQKQRAAIARALAVQPSLLLMDEPFGALDAYTRAELQDELLTLWKKTGKTILFVTHDRSEAQYLADRILMLDTQKPIRATQEEVLFEERPRKRLKAH